MGRNDNEHFHSNIERYSTLLRVDEGGKPVSAPGARMDGLSKKGFRINCMFHPFLRFLVTLICAVSSVAPTESLGAELKDETLKTWDTYLQAADLQIGSRPNGPFLWVDQVPDRQQHVREGEILVSSAGPENPKPVPSGLIHDWIGAAFIPDTTLDAVLSAVRDYGDYKEFYKPTVVDSKLLGTDGACDRYSMRVVNKEAVAETALDMEYKTCYHRIDERRWYSITETTRVQELRHYGRANGQELSPDHAPGFIWRLYSVARFEERDGGIYIELEAVALSRDVPVALRWVVNPIVRRVSRNSMLVSLQQMKEAVNSTEAAKTKSAVPTIAANPSRGAVASGVGNRLVPRQKP